MPNFETFEKRIGVSFKNRNLLMTAFVHRSYVNENRGRVKEHNERLEFLGDAVLELVVTHYLYNTYADATEGDLTSYRAALVNTTTLSAVATELGMNEFLLLSRGEAKDVGRARQYILANTFEAMVGAIYLDQEYEAARGFIARFLLSKTEAIVEGELWKDAKSRFQEIAQDRVSITPSYKTLKESGPDHDKHFTVGVFLVAELVAEGAGASKQEAEQDAAKNALRAKRW